MTCFRCERGACQGCDRRADPDARCDCDHGGRFCVVCWADMPPDEESVCGLTCRAERDGEEGR